MGCKTTKICNLPYIVRGNDHEREQHICAKEFGHIGDEHECGCGKKFYPFRHLCHRLRCVNDLNGDKGYHQCMEEPDHPAGYHQCVCEFTWDLEEAKETSS